MKRRSFLAGAAGGLGAAVVTSSARAQGSPEIKWRMATGWPKSLDTIYGSAEDMCKRIGELTEARRILLA